MDLYKSKHRKRKFKHSSACLFQLFLFILLGHSSARNISPEAKRIQTLRDAFNSKQIHYFIADPKLLLSATESNGKVDSICLETAKEVKQRLENANVKWVEIPKEVNRRFTIGFASEANFETGGVDSIPYTEFDYCISNGIQYLAAFYLYKKNSRSGILTDEQQHITLPIGGRYVAPMSIGIDIDIRLKNIQFCYALYTIHPNRRIEYICTNDDDYVSFKEIAEELFEKLE